MIKPTAMKYVIGKFSLFYFYYYSAFWLEYCQNIWTCGFYLFSLPVSTIPPLPQNCKSFQISGIRFLDEYFKFWRAYFSLKIILQEETVIEQLDEFRTVSLIVGSLVSKKYIQTISKLGNFCPVKLLEANFVYKNHSSQCVSVKFKKRQKKFFVSIKIKWF